MSEICRSFYIRVVALLHKPLLSQEMNHLILSEQICSHFIWFIIQILSVGTLVKKSDTTLITFFRTLCSIFILPPRVFDLSAISMSMFLMEVKQIRHSGSFTFAELL